MNDGTNIQSCKSKTIQLRLNSKRLKTLFKNLPKWDNNHAVSRLCDVSLRMEYSIEAHSFCGSTWSQWMGKKSHSMLAEGIWKLFLKFLFFQTNNGTMERRENFQSKANLFQVFLFGKNNRERKKYGLSLMDIKN